MGEDTLDTVIWPDPPLVEEVQSVDQQESTLRIVHCTPLSAFRSLVRALALCILLLKYRGPPTGFNFLMCEGGHQDSALN